jgi:hypothetical protein
MLKGTNLNPFCSYQLKKERVINRSYLLRIAIITNSYVIKKKQAGFNPKLLQILKALKIFPIDKLLKDHLHTN